MEELQVFSLWGTVLLVCVCCNFFFRLWWYIHWNRTRVSDHFWWMDWSEAIFKISCMMKAYCFLNKKFSPCRFRKLCHCVEPRYPWRAKWWTAADVCGMQFSRISLVRHGHFSSGLVHIFKLLKIGCWCRKGQINKMNFHSKFLIHDWFKARILFYRYLVFLEDWCMLNCQGNVTSIF